MDGLLELGAGFIFIMYVLMKQAPDSIFEYASII